MHDRPLEDWEYPEPDENEEDAETRDCPSCRAAIYEDAERCPACGEYIVFSDAAFSGWPWWLVSLGLIGIAAVVLTLIRGF